MAYGVIPGARFGGLDLRSVSDASVCIDGIDFDIAGDRLRARDGFTLLTDQLIGGSLNHLAPFYRYSSMQLLGQKAGSVSTAVFDSFGGHVATDTAVDGWFFTRFGTPTAERIYYVNASVGPTPIRRWDGTSFSKPVGMETGVYLAVQPKENRLVVADGGLAITNDHPYRVKFSRELDAEAWDGETVDLDPGDGDPITGLATWRDLLFAFKRRRFYVFYGNATDGAGDTEFRYRSVDTGGVGHVADESPLAVAPEGVYFLDSTGIYLTAGGPPQKVSGALDPLFTGKGLSPLFSGEAVSDPRTGALVYHEGRLYVSLAEGTGTTNNVTYVFDGRDWMRWSVGFKPGQAASVHLGWPASGRASLLIAQPDGLWEWGGDDDVGNAVVGSYRTGFVMPGLGQETDIARTRLWGSGAVTVGKSKDYGLINVDSRVEVQLGVSPLVGAGLYDRQNIGSAFSYEFAGDGPWELYAYNHEVRGSRPPGSRSG